MVKITAEEFEQIESNEKLTIIKKTASDCDFFGIYLYVYTGTRASFVVAHEIDGLTHSYWKETL